MEDAIRTTEDSASAEAPADASIAAPAPTTPEDPTELRLQLHRHGYRPVPVLGAHVAMKAAGKRPMMKGWEVATRDARHHAATHDVTVLRSGPKQTPDLHQTHQTSRERTATHGTIRENFRTVVTSRKRRISSRRAVPPGHIRMWGPAAHCVASVRAGHA